MKKALSLILAIVMVALMAFSVSATSVSVTSGDTSLLENHTYKAYQVFGGTVYNETDSEGKITNTIFSDVVWGNGIKGSELLTALKNDSTFIKDGTNVFANIVDDTTVDTDDAAAAAAVAAIISNWGENSTEAKQFAELVYAYKKGDGTVIPTTGESADLSYGYYLIVDTTTVNGVVNEVANAALLKVVNDESIEISVKTDKPSVEKKVKEDEKTVTATADEKAKYGDNYNDVADYDIGEAIPFALYSKVPDMEYYDYYEIVFHDTMASELEFISITSVKIGDTTLNLDNGDYTFTETENGFDLKIVLKENGVAKYSETSAIRVDYTAKLTTNANAGLNGYINTVNLEYSNNPNDASSTGKTTDDTVIVFTYAVKVAKTDGNGTALPGVKFALKNSAGKYATVDANNKFTGWSDTETALTTDASGYITIIGLDDDTYTLVEVEGLPGYNSIEDIDVEINADTNNDQTWTYTSATESPKAALEAVNGEINGDIITDSSHATVDFTDGTVVVPVVNNRGAGLPETGGIGTTIFYIVGGLLMFGAVVFLVARKRTSAED